MSRTPVTVLGLVVASMLVLTACGNDGDSSDSGSDATDTSTIEAADSSLGEILVDGSGRTLYLFTEDGENSNAMDCDAECLKLWPVVEGEPSAGDGVDADLIGTTTTEGTAQATYAGHPLYYYANDESAGDVNGQGIDKIWYVLDAEGNAITASAPADTGGGGGY